MPSCRQRIIVPLGYPTLESTSLGELQQWVLFTKSDGRAGKLIIINGARIYDSRIVSLRKKNSNGYYGWENNSE